MKKTESEVQHPHTEAARQTSSTASDSWWKDRQYVNILLVSVGFMLISTSRFTTSAIANNVLSDMKQYGFQGSDGYITSAIVGGAQLVSTPFAPLVVAVIGCKWACILGGCGHLLMVGSFLFHSRALIFIMSAVFGICFASYWVGLGLVLVINTTPKTADKGMATFWVLYNGAQIWGNIFIAVKFSDVTFIDESLRLMTFSILLATAVVGNIILLFIKHPLQSSVVPNATESSNKALPTVARELQTLSLNFPEQRKHSSGQPAPPMSPSSVRAEPGQKNRLARLYSRLRPSLALAVSPLMLGSLGYFGFAGINVIIMMTPIPTAIGFNQHLGSSRKRLMGINGFCMGAAEIVGGLAIMAVTNRYLKRVHVYLIGTTFSAIAIIFSVLNAPFDATLNDSSRPSILFGDGASSPLISIACAILFGISDAATNITMLALVSDVFGHEHDETIETVNLQTTTRFTPFVNPAFENEIDSTRDAIRTHTFPAEDMRRRKSILSTSPDGMRRVSIVIGHPPHVLAPPSNNVPAEVKLQHEQAMATASAVLNGLQAAMQALMMVLSSYLWFYWYLVILIPCGIWASVSFYFIDRNYRAGKYRDRFRA